MAIVKALAILMFVLLSLSPSSGGVTNQSGEKSEHCCTVVKIDLRNGTVTARETATGYTFRIEVRNRKHLAALKIGGKVWADFAVRKVRLETAGDTLCCPIMNVDTKPQPLVPIPNLFTRS